MLPEVAGRRNTAQLVGALQKRAEAGHPPPVIVIDGLDEARGHTFTIAGELVVRLTRTASLGRWRRHKLVSAGKGVLESTPVFRGGMDTRKWQVETEKDPGLPGVLRVAVDGFLIGSVERLATGRYAGRWEGHPVPERPCTRRQDAVVQVLAAEVAARQRYFAAYPRVRRQTT